MSFHPSNPLNAYQTMREKEEHELTQKEKKYFAEAIKKITDSAELQATLAKQEAESAKKEALFSKIIAVLSLLVSIGTILYEVLFG